MLDQGSCVLSGVMADARGFSRPWDDPGTMDLDDGCDIGAYEARDVNGNGIEDGRDLFRDGFETGDTSSWTSTVP